MPLRSFSPPIDHSKFAVTANCCFSALKRLCIDDETDMAAITRERGRAGR